MNTPKSTITLLLLAISFSVFTQTNDENANLFFTLRQLTENSWGVFVKPSDLINPSLRTAAGSGQVTLVANADFHYNNLQNHGGSWIENARVNNPSEAPGKAYISFGFVTDEPKINLQPSIETLLFTFEANPHFSGTFKLIENNNDPFSTPNSYGTNPGNDLGIIDFGVEGGLQYYIYSANYYEEPFENPAILATQKELENATDAMNDVKAILTSTRIIQTANGPK